MAQLVIAASSERVDAALDVNLVAAFFPLLVILELESDVVAHPYYGRCKVEIVLGFCRRKGSRVIITVEKGRTRASPRVSLPCGESRAERDQQRAH